MSTIVEKLFLMSKSNGTKIRHLQRDFLTEVPNKCRWLLLKTYQGGIGKFEMEKVIFIVRSKFFPHSPLLIYIYMCSGDLLLK